MMASQLAMKLHVLGSTPSDGLKSISTTFDAALLGDANQSVFPTVEDELCISEVCTPARGFRAPISDS